jgi:multidrug efflux pump subunit AcrA (membrane-fusion protein)
MNKLNWLAIGLIGIAGVAIALSNPTTLSSRNPGSVQANDSSQLIPNNSELNSPRRLTVTVKVQEPQDLKVQEVSVVKKGQVIAARDREKQRLESQKQQLTLSLQKLQSYTPLEHRFSNAKNYFLGYSANEISPFENSRNPRIGLDSEY